VKQNSSGLREALEALAWKASPLAPFSDKGMIYHALSASAGSVLSVGCGNGEKDRFITRRRNRGCRLVGVDLFEPYLRACRDSRAYDALVMADASRLPFAARSFDTVIGAEIVEHLEREEAERLLDEMERIARREVIVTCPVGYLNQDEYDDNPLQVHRSGFTPAEFVSRGYKVRGVGLRWAWQGGDVSLWRSSLTAIGSLLPLAYYLPSLGGAMVCVKRLR
jgi:SAM-dependent methyltransferase